MWSRVAGLAARPEVVLVDGEVGNSTHAEELLNVCPERYFEVFIAEQQLDCHRGRPRGRRAKVALEDLAALRAVHGSVVLCPADTPAAAALVAQMAETDGIVCLCATRGASPSCTRPGRCSPSGNSRPTGPRRTTRSR